MIILGIIILVILLVGLYFITIESYHEAKEEAVSWEEGDWLVYSFQFFLEFCFAFTERLLKFLGSLILIGVIIGIIIGIIYWIFFN